MEQKMKLDTSYKNAFRNALYVRSSNMLTGFIDGILTSAFLGVNSMAAYGIASPYFMMNSILSYLLVTGSQVLLTSKIGLAQNDEGKNVFSTAIWLSFIISALISAAGIIFAGPFAIFLGASGEAAKLAPETAGYLRWLFAGNIFHNFVSVSSAPLQMDGGSKYVRAAGITTFAVDVSGDLLNVFLFKGGLAGMGVATAVSNMCAACVCLMYFFRDKRLFSLSPSFIKIKYIPEFLRLGYSQSIYGIAAFFGNILINRLVIQYAGLVAMFGMTTFKNLALFFNIFCAAVGDANLLLIGLHIGECDRAAVDRVFSNSLKIITGLLPFSLLLILFSHPLALLYAEDSLPQAINCAQAAVIAFGIQMPFTALFLASLKGLQAFRRSALSSALNFAKALVFPCVLLLILADKGYIGVFAALAGAEVLSSILTVFLFRNEKSHSSMLQISPNDIISSDISSSVQAVTFSQKAADFCRAHGIPSETGNAVALCAEEVAVCILNYGNEMKIENTIVNIIILLRGNKLVMRIKDNCPLNDLRDQAEKWTLHENGPDSSMGLRMALMLSDNFQYIPIMDQSNTIISFNI